MVIESFKLTKLNCKEIIFTMRFIAIRKPPVPAVANVVILDAIWEVERFQWLTV
jgi:hypothetical protein